MAQQNPCVVKNSLTHIDHSPVIIHRYVTYESIRNYWPMVARNVSESKLSFFHMEAAFSNSMLPLLKTSDKEKKYALLSKMIDTLAYFWLEPTYSSSPNHTAKYLARCMCVFITPSTCVSGQGSHFKNEVMEQLASEYRIRHKFSVAYSPWANGTVESLMRSILSATRAMLAELKLAPQDPIYYSGSQSSKPISISENSNGISRSLLEAMTISILNDLVYVFYLQIPMSSIILLLTILVLYKFFK